MADMSPTSPMRHTNLLSPSSPGAPMIQLSPMVGLMSPMSPMSPTTPRNSSQSCAPLAHARPRNSGRVRNSSQFSPHSLSP
eukprot:1508636-Pyramimonas_sp.AAC.1